MRNGSDGIMKEYKVPIQSLIDHIKTALDVDPWAKEMAEELLKEREPVKPYVDIDEAKCPDCKVRLTRQEMIGDDMLYEDFFDYCPRCGRPVKWG